MIQPLDFDSNSDSDSLSDDENDGGNSYDKLHRVKALSVRQAESITDNLLKYEGDLRAYKSKLEKWEDYKDTQEDLETYENTLVELIRVFVCEHSRIPTNLEIQQVYRPHQYKINNDKLREV